MPRLSQPMSFAARFGRQQADQAIKKDVVRALVELISNSDDDYNRIELKGGQSDGRIVVAVKWRHNNSEIKVLDFAQGMPQKKLDESLGVYAQETSGMGAGDPVRGYFGRGLKDAILGVGEGQVFTIRNDILNQAWLGIKEGRPWYEAEDETVARPEMRNDLFLGIPHEGSGTLVDMRDTREDVHMPRKENLQRQLETYYALREIMSSPRRVVELWVLPTQQKTRLHYSYPAGEVVLEREADVTYCGECFSARIVVNRCYEPLTLPSEHGPYAEAGLLIMGEHPNGATLILDNTLFSFERSVGADRFYGKVICPHLVSLLKKDEQIVRATRDGLDWEHPFNRELKKAVEREIEPLIKEEEAKLRAAERESHDTRHREKKQAVVTALNDIAKTELSSVPEDFDETRQPFVPSDGIAFVPTFATIVYRRDGRLLVRGRIPETVQVGDTVDVQSTSSVVVVKTPRVSIDEKPEWPDIGEATVIIEGLQIGAESIITGCVGELKCEALVRVIAKAEPTKKKTKPKPRGGIIKDILFSPDADPRLRVKYRDGEITIATRSQSVLPYVDIDGTLWSTAQSQVLLAELVTEAVGREIAERGVRSGKFVAPPGAVTEAIQREFRRIQNFYASKIHEAIVEAKYRSKGSDSVRRGRPSKETMLDDSVAEIE